MRDLILPVDRPERIDMAVDWLVPFGGEYVNHHRLEYRRQGPAGGWYAIGKEEAVGPFRNAWAARSFAAPRRSRAA